LERREDDARIVEALIYRRYSFLDPEQRIHRCLSRSDRVLNGKHNVIGDLGKLTDKRQVLRTFGHDIGSVAGLAD
jgi:hypothetical protein